ncbi:cell division control protein 6 [Anaerohalosphaera lusitana]|uniref:Cell division control protein 6 n=1 Tax=Anaerohalosphaera lusitana TaxID=1936003 RepID=A0A1U9NMK2_9BACT|nr:AAA family ATPase [Anaerohalosphaera lusitana]AQT68736.1 cell division control protein 6 [Anaerohalosphaera lusitana]
MDLTEYVQRQKHVVAQQSRAVRDFTVFDYNYIPEKPFIRSESKQIIDAMLRFDVSGIATNFAVIGSRGSGKTLTMKYLARVVPAQTDLSMRYVNCRHHNTSFKILARLLNKRCTGLSLDKLFEMFSESITGKTVFVLDEVDLMSAKDKNRDILYLLSRSEKPVMVIMLSNNPHLLRELDAASKSSLQLVQMHFANYNAEQINAILLERAQKGLVSYDYTEVSEIAAMTTKKTNSDTRVAIKTLYYNVTEPQKSVESCFENARKDIVIDVINDLSDQNLLILTAAAQNKSDLTKNIYDLYCRLCRSQCEKPFSYVYYYSNLGYLQSIGLIALVSTKFGRTYTNRVVLTFNHSILFDTCRLRFSRVPAPRS